MSGPSSVSAGTKWKAADEGGDTVSQITSIATTQSSSKRMKVESVDFVPKKHMLNQSPQSIPGHVPQATPGAGCKWSPTDWSCAYDTVFMVLFYTYHKGDDTFKKMLRCASNGFKDLTKAFETLTESDSNLFSQNLFDTFRDQFHDRLNAHDPISFPRVGQVGTSVVSILESLLPHEIREVELVPLCSNVECAEKSRSSSHSPLYVQTGQQDDLNTESMQITLLNIQQWLDLWYTLSH
ncbi:hypothetical protein EDD15DRAFT_2197751 [Pisolithus albus]|nr:hypothetical protein EDD15DRAFT_2197751 [Pisolithus albus]